MTSHDCISKLRRLLHMKRIGHGGTLDPLAIGVLPIALGPATRLLNYLPTGKTYRATIRLGMATTTDDLAGDVLSTAPVGALTQLTQTQVVAALAHFQGPLKQVPPAYSAIQVQGKRCYDLARQGKPVTVPPRSVEVYQIQLLAWHPTNTNRADGTGHAEVDVEIHCSAGTYIRAIARDLGAALGVGGTLAHLHRTHSGGFSSTESLTFTMLSQQLEQAQLQPISPSLALHHLPSVTLDSNLAQRFCWGQKLPWSPTSGQEQYRRVQQPDGTFLGIGQLEDGVLRAKVVCGPAPKTLGAG